MYADKSYPTLKEAARILGIHEQAIRNWERREIIHPVRLPGSRIRRIPITEIERVKERTASSYSLTATYPLTSAGAPPGIVPE